MTYQQSFPGVDKWEVTTSAVDIHWSVHKRLVKTLGNMMWLQTSEGTCMYVRGNDINAHWHWQIVNLKMNATTHRTGSWLARPKKGGVKWVSIPHVKRNDRTCLPPWCRKYSHLPEEGPSPPVKWWLFTLHWRHWKTKISQETRIDSQTMRMWSSKRKGGQLDNPQGE